VTGRNAPF